MSALSSFGSRRGGWRCFCGGACSSVVCSGCAGGCVVRTAACLLRSVAGSYLLCGRDWQRQLGLRIAAYLLACILTCRRRDPSSLSQPIIGHTPMSIPTACLRPSYTPAQLYELVSDVPAYAGFIPFCTTSTVLDKAGRARHDWTPGREPFEVDAELAVGFGGLEERYISRVVGTPFQSVSATASERTPLFKNLVTTWSFAPMSPGGDTAAGPTLLTIDLTFSFANPLHRIASQAVLPKVADKMVEAFETRANEVWGTRR